MIHLMRLKGPEIVVNADLIKFIEAAPDTMLTLVGGEKLLIQESPDEVIAKVIAYKREINGPPPMRALELN